MAYRFPIFDLDYTLVHTPMSYVYGMTRKILKGFDVQAKDEEIKAWWFDPELHIAAPTIFGIPRKRFVEAYRGEDTPEARRPHSKPYDDVSVLHDLRRKGYPLAIVTGGRPDIVELNIGLLGVDFDCVVNAHPLNGMKYKPHPEGIVVCLEKLGARPEEAVYVGDTRGDMLAAKAAGVLDVLIDREEHQALAEPSVTIRSLHEVPSLLGK